MSQRVGEESWPRSYGKPEEQGRLHLSDHVDGRNQRHSWSPPTREGGISRRGSAPCSVALATGPRSHANGSVMKQPLGGKQGAWSWSGRLLVSSTGLGWAAAVSEHDTVSRRTLGPAGERSRRGRALHKLRLCHPLPACPRPESPRQVPMNPPHVLVPPPPPSLCGRGPGWGGAAEAQS